MEPTLHNPARERLEAGELALGVGIRQSRTVDIAAIMKVCGYDWLFLDLEHNSMDLDTAVQISVAALGAGIAPRFHVPVEESAGSVRLRRHLCSNIVVTEAEKADHPGVR
jgi:4-hydroxy-2-oxoheptanedioate aldolase